MQRSGWSHVADVALCGEKLPTASFCEHHILLHQCHGNEFCLPAWIDRRMKTTRMACEQFTGKKGADFYVVLMAIKYDPGEQCVDGWLKLCYNLNSPKLLESCAKKLQNTPSGIKWPPVVSPDSLTCRHQKFPTKHRLRRNFIPSLHCHMVIPSRNIRAF